MALIDLTILSSIEELQTVADRVDDLAEKQGWAQKALFALQVSLDEWISNLIKYSYENTADKPIRITVSEQGGKIIAQVFDEGAPFDPTATPVPVTLEETLTGKREGGMGLFVMQHLLADIAYQRKGNQNIVTLSVAQ